MIPAALWLRETPPGPSGNTDEGAPSGPTGVRTFDAVRKPVFWFLLAGFFLFSVSVNSSVAHLIPVLTDHGIGSGTAALAASTLGALTLFGRLLTGLLLDRFCGSRVSGVFFAIAALGPLLMGWSYDRFHSCSTALLALSAAMLTGAAVLASLPRYPLHAVEAYAVAATPQTAG